MNNDELISAGHELAKCLDSNTPLIDIAKLLSKMAAQLDVTTAALREKTKQCEQLAAENAALKAGIGESYDEMEQLDEGHFSTDADGEPMDTLISLVSAQAAIQKLGFDIKTPATDAFLREVRAQGVEMFAESKYCQDESQSGAHEFTAQLRQGGAA
ncbi:hypothetical protein [Cronobacter muytjensii]|uniref:hypothetical protein n=1 Tax=Cronobacter muytjensii TaxID=413501 RepID=UPI0029F9A3AC|nr:hypothetical protein [Cronobacter muytjensii]